MFADSDGEIQSHCCGVPPLPPAGVPGVGTRETHYVKNSTLTAYTEEQRIAKANRPQFAIRWCNVTMKWLVDEESRKRVEALVALQDAKRTYETATEQPIIVGAKLYQADAKSRAAMREALDLLSPGSYVSWILANNTETLITREALAEIYRDILERNATLFANYQAQRTQA